MLYAPNPALAFVGTTFASYTPFTLPDVCTLRFALAWAVAYSIDLRRLFEFERERLSTVGEARAEMERTMEMEGEGEGKEGAKAEASTLLEYGVLVPLDVRERTASGGGLWAPELDTVLPVWNPERTAVREVMFNVKRRALELDRAREVKEGDREDAQTRGFAQSTE
ncbi:hypothetical protein B0H11DRAFT_2242233 [Mycena galericulata]|nr:hypothetical protein B0H11DRAFT_2242233 [Mycena galericulata]